MKIFDSFIILMITIYLLLGSGCRIENTIEAEGGFLAEKTQSFSK